MTIAFETHRAATLLALSMLVACAAGSEDRVDASADMGDRRPNGSSSGGGGNSSVGGMQALATGGRSSAGSGGSAVRGDGGAADSSNAGSSAAGSDAGGRAGTGGQIDSGASAGTGGSAGGGGGQPGSGKLIASAVFYEDIHAAALDGESATLIAALQNIGWGDDGKRTTLGIDFSFEINQADANVARRPFVQPSDALPDCDTAPVPLPAGGKTEGSDNYACSGGDCHLLVYQGTRLYELYQADVTSGAATGGDFTGTCLVIWDLTKDYWKPAAPPNFGRGDHCNGADAGDMPIAPLLITAEELNAGEIRHALRFTISNNRIREGVYLHPATHIGGPSGGSEMLPYGSRLRLRADYPLASLPDDAARIVARALQTYGMFLADGGNIYISATTDAADAISGSALGALTPSDFEMVEGGDRIPWSGYDCSRTPIAD